MKPLLSEIVSRVDLLGHMFQLLTSEKMVVMDVSGALEAAGKHSDLQVFNFLMVIFYLYDDHAT